MSGPGLVERGLVGRGLVGPGLVGRGLVGPGLVERGLVGRGLVGPGMSGPPLVGRFLGQKSLKKIFLGITSWASKRWFWSCWGFRGPNMFGVFAGQICWASQATLFCVVFVGFLGASEMGQGCNRFIFLNRILLSPSWAALLGL